MSFGGGGFGGFGQTNNNQSSGFGGFGQNNNNNSTGKPATWCHPRRIITPMLTLYPERLWRLHWWLWSEQQYLWRWPLRRSQQQQHWRWLRCLDEYVVLSIASLHRGVCRRKQILTKKTITDSIPSQAADLEPAQVLASVASLLLVLAPPVLRAAASSAAAPTTTPPPARLASAAVLALLPTTQTLPRPLAAAPAPAAASSATPRTSPPLARPARREALCSAALPPVPLPTPAPALAASALPTTTQP